VTGQPDYRNALLFEPRGDTYRRAFYRLLGTSTRLWVRAEETSTRHDLGERFVGRLLRFGSLPYAEQVRGYYGTLKVTRLLDLAPFERRARGEVGPDFLRALTDRAGEAVPIPDPSKTTVTVAVDFPDELVISLSKERFAVESDARREVERLGVPVAPAKIVEGEGAGYDYVVRMPAGGRDALIAAAEARDFAVRARHERFRVPLETLGMVFPGGHGLPLRLGKDQPPFYAVQGNALVPADAPPPAGAAAGPPGMEAQGTFRIVPFSVVESIQVDAPVVIPHDAWIVVEGDLPSAYGWAKALAVLLLLFMGWSAWLLTRAVPRR
jgi:hypothetical protein